MHIETFDKDDLWPDADDFEDSAQVKCCASDTCGWLFLDDTKNHSRRWCDMADCGSQAKAKRYYRKKSSASLRVKEGNAGKNQD